MKKSRSAFVLVFVMMLSIMTQTVYATSERRIEVSVSSRSVCESYAVYERQMEAQENPIRLYVAEDEFPVTVTFVRSNGTTRKYSFDSYGVKQIKARDISSRGTIIAETDFGVVNYALTKQVYSMIIIEEAEGVVNAIPEGNPTNVPEEVQKPTEVEPVQDPAQEQPKQENVQEPPQNSVQEQPSQESTQEPIQGPELEPEPEPEPEIEVTPEWEIDQKLQPLREKISFEVSEERYFEEIKDYILGNWDGELRQDDDELLNVTATRSIYSRNYRWSGFNQLTGEIYKDIDINIDYIGELVAVSGQDFTLAIDYSQGIIEKWRLLQLEDSWNIPLEGETIETITVEQTPTESESHVAVVTVDGEGMMHTIMLYPNGEIQKVA